MGSGRYLKACWRSCRSGGRFSSESPSPSQSLLGSGPSMIPSGTCLRRSWSRSSGSGTGNCRWALSHAASAQPGRRKFPLFNPAGRESLSEGAHPRLLGRSVLSAVRCHRRIDVAFRPGARACPGLALPRGRHRRLSPPLRVAQSSLSPTCAAPRSLRLLLALPIALANLRGLLPSGEPVPEGSLSGL